MWERKLLPLKWLQGNPSPQGKPSFCPAKSRKAKATLREDISAGRGIALMVDQEDE